MNVFLLEPCCTLLFIVLANVVMITEGAEHGSGSEANYFSGEFENFLHGLGSMVYKYKKPARHAPDKDGNGQGGQFGDSTLTPTRAYRRNENIIRTQKEVLKDVLMMKLVSYYEDKYKIMHTENQDLVATTPTVPAVGNNVHTYTEYDDLPRLHTFDERPRPVARRNESPRTSQQPSRRRFRNTVMHRDMAEVIVL